MEALPDRMTLYQTYRNGGKTIVKSNGEVIYSSPHDHHQKPKEIDEKYAAKVITEKYDSIKCLDSHLDGLHISDSCDSKSSSDGSSSRQGSSTIDEYEEPAYQCPDLHNVDITHQEVAQIEVFFCSHKTSVYVCQCLANLYFTTVESDNSPGEWTLARTGVPVLLLDKGDTKARDKRMLQIVLAEKGSGFGLWKDVIDNLSNYKAEDSTFHTMYLSADHRRMAGFSYDNEEAAETFLRQVEQLTSDPLNISLSVPKNKKKKKLKQTKKKEKMLPLRKCDISNPCRFEHVTSVALNDKKKLFSMATLLTPSGNN